MRVFLAGIVICALGATAATALPISSPDTLSASKDSALIQIAKRGGAKPQAKKSKSSGGDSGIHPLVGSGGY